jgi:hypothetical protein
LIPASRSISCALGLRPIARRIAKVETLTTTASGPSNWVEVSPVTVVDEDAVTTIAAIPV